MDLPQSTPSDCCQKCGAQLIPGRPKCWLCNAELPTQGAGEAVVIASVAPELPRPFAPTGRFQFGLSSLLLLMTLVAILCSIIKMNPGLGIVVAVLAVPALLWTVFVAMRRGGRGNPMSAGGKAAVFLLTLFTVVGVLVAVIGAFVAAVLATCAATSGPGPGNFGDPVLALICGGVAALVVAILCAWVLWKVLRHKRRR
jgi:hypothetical protein